MASHHYESGNRLLAGLPDFFRNRFLADCDVIELELTKILCEFGDHPDHVYFPTAGFISLTAAANEQETLCVAVVGDEGMIGTTLFLSGGASQQRAAVQGRGRALRMSAPLFRRHCEQSPWLRRILSLYVGAFVRELAQSAVCGHYHCVGARLGRLLLTARDRVHSDDFHLTHETISSMLGVRREGITSAASSLQARSLITYRRGSISIVNGPGLEEAACLCYRLVRETYEQALDPLVRAEEGEICADTSPHPIDDVRSFALG